MADKFFGGNKLLNATELLQKAGIAEGWQVADLGCGANGHFLFPAAKLVGPQGKVYAVDVRKFVLDHIKSRCEIEGIENIVPIWANLENYETTGIPSYTLDLAILVNVLFQSQKHFAILREARRITKKGGRILAVDWKKTRTAVGPPQDWRVDPEALEAMFYRLELEIKEKFDAGKYHFGFLLEKN